MKRTLRLQRESLTELTTGELGGVVGATHAGCGATNNCTHETIDVCGPVPTLPAAICLSLKPGCIQTR